MSEDGEIPPEAGETPSTADAAREALAGAPAATPAGDGAGADANVVAFPSKTDRAKRRPKGKGGGKSGGSSASAGGEERRSPRKVRDFGGWQLPPDCPVSPLGTYDGAFFYLDTVGQLRSLKARDHGNKDLLALFAPKTGFLHETWPRYDKEGNLTGWRPEEAGEVLMCACAAAGVWNAQDKRRDRGVWLDAAGGLIVHVGDEVLIEGQWQKTGMHGRYVYPSAPPVPRPLDGPADTDAIDELLGLIRSWNWQRPETDPYLLLGWMACAFLGGALDWRPIVWLTGDKGTGKSTLHALIKGVMGEGLLSTSDASEAGVRQSVGHQTLPVAIDEAEAEEDNRKLKALVKLARQASSGGNVVRGGSDHTAHAFTARACFLLSSILIPPLQGQDRSRLAVLDLGPFPKEAREPVLDAGWMEKVGGTLRRRLLDGWPRFGETLRAYREMLREAGHDGRGSAQFGVLLAGADLLLSSTTPKPEDIEPWKALMGAGVLGETREAMTDTDRCLAHLLTSAATLEGGSRPQTVAHWIGRAADELDAEPDLATGKRPDTAARSLAVLGLRVMDRTDKKSRTQRRWVMVPVAHQGLAKLFQGTHWQASSGAAGVWGQSLGRLVMAERDQNVRIGGVQQKCVAIPLERCLDMGPEG
jgi:hypothetical protein